MVRWATLVPSRFEVKEQAAKALEMTQALLARVLPSDAEASTQKIVETVKETMQDPRGQAAVASMAVLAVTIAYLRSKRPKKLPTIRQILEEEPDLTYFSGEWEELSDAGPWDKPNLNHSLEQSSLIVFAPTNRAFQLASPKTMNLDKAKWRKLLITHVAQTSLPQEDLERRASVVCCTNLIVPLSIIKDTFSDETVQARRPLQASNGLVYLIDEVLMPDKLSIASA